MPEIIKHGETGFIAQNSQEYSEYLTKLLTDKKLREKMGEKAKKLVGKDFNWDQCAGEYLDLYAKKKVKKL